MMSQNTYKTTAVVKICLKSSKNLKGFWCRKEIPHIELRGEIALGFLLIFLTTYLCEQGSLYLIENEQRNKTSSEYAKAVMKS